MIKILVVDDEPHIRQLIKLNLELEGFEVETAENGAVALALAQKKQFNLFVVDIMMPIMNGIDFVKALRQNGNLTPAIIASAKGEIEDKIEGFAAGIDDYMTKPLNFDELKLRVYALLRRAQILRDKQFVIGDYQLKYNELSITELSSGKKLVLPPKEFYILYKLLSFPEQVFTKDALFEEFWGLDNNSFDDTVKTHIHNLRGRIGCFAGIDIVTVRGVGYYGKKK